MPWCEQPKGYKRLPKDQLIYKLRVPNPERMTIMKQVGGAGRVM
jgi:hypothetical protein